MLTFIGIIVVIVAALLSILLVFLFDSVGGTPLSERVTVKQRKFVPAHLMFVGKTMIPVPNRWTLNVVGENGQGAVTVSQAFYEATTKGDFILVTGKKGRMSGNWYLKAASQQK